MTNVVYHYTDTLRLPWIILADALQPGRNKTSELPFDFVWATTSERGQPLEKVTIDEYRARA